MITPPMPDFNKVGLEDGFQVFLYRDIEQMGNAFNRAKGAAISGGREYSKRIRQWAEENSYERRIEQAIKVLQENGVV